MHRRSLLALLTALFVLPATAPALAQRQLTQEEIDLINAISAHNSTITTMAGRFLQIDSRGNRIEGTFGLQRPGKIRFRYNPPSREEIMSVGQGFYVIDRKEKTQYVYPQDKIPLRQFLAERIDLLNAGLVSIGHSDNYVELTLQEDTPAGVVRIDLVFDRQTLELVQWVLHSPDGSDLTFSVFDVEKGVPIPASFFYLNINDYRTANPNG
jgi:outer membrane lipoprotein-sorting protein